MNKHQHKRRGFLVKMMALSGGLALPFKGRSAGMITEDSKLKNRDAFFIAESGMLAYDDFFYLGGIYVTSNTAKWERKIKQIRAKYGYKFRLSFASADRYKLPFAKDLIDWFFAQNELLFLSGRFTSKYTTGIKNSASNWTILEEKCDCYKVLTALQTTSGNCSVKAKMVSAYGPSPFFKDAFHKKTGLSYEEVDTRSSQLLQLADLILGCIAAAERGNVENPTKLAVLEHFASHLGGDIQFGKNNHSLFKAL